MIGTYKITVPNRIINAGYNCGLIEERALNTILYELQKYIKPQLSGVAFTQLDLFTPKNPKLIIDIDLSMIGKRQQYCEIKRQLIDFTKKPFEIPYYDSDKKKRMVLFTNLIDVSFPENEKGPRTASIIIEKSKGRALIELERNNRGKACHHSTFSFNTTQKVKCKYTPRIYKKLAYWESKGTYVISLNEFRKMLSIEGKYNEYRDLKHSVLLPSQNELEEKADRWFNCNAKDFVIRKNRKVVALRFKVITPAISKFDQIKRQDIINQLKQALKLTDEDILQIDDILLEPVHYEPLYQLMGRVIDKSLKEKITDIRKFSITCIEKEFEIKLLKM